jgi:hypothetical protein
MGHYEKLGGAAREDMRTNANAREAWTQAAAAYREILYLDGEERLREDPTSGEVSVARRGMTREEVAQVLQSGGKLSPAQMLRCRVRVFTDGVLIGSRKFLEDFKAARPDYFGPKRKTAARRIHGCDTDLCTARALRKDALGPAPTASLS